MSSTSPSERLPTPLTPSHERGNASLPALSAPLTPLLGREREVSEILALLDGDDTRLLTLTGPGGIGKTRLALEVASRVQHDFAHGACFVQLAAIRDPDLVPFAIAQALGVRESGDRPVAEVLATVLRAQHLLLVLDNMEQVIAAAPWLAEFLAACPRITALVTSRARLRIRGEQAFPVPPLPLPVAGLSQSIGALSQFAAVQLFLQRARAVQPTLNLNEANAATIRDICQRLDGLPLAIELAAARANVLSPSELLARLSNLDLLTGTMQDVPARLQTMRNAIAWSYDLLSPDEQSVFRRLAVFVEGFTVELAQAVVFAGNGGVEPDVMSSGAMRGGEPDTLVLDLIASLIDQSLVRQLPAAGSERRFGMLETIREYGLHQLGVSGELDVIADRHAACFLALAEQAAPQLTGPEQASWLHRLEVAHSNLRAAFAWLHERGEDERSLRLAIALWRFGYTRGNLTDARMRLETALSASAPATTRAEALNGAGVLASVQGDTGVARAYHSEALDLCRAHGDRHGEAMAFNGLGEVAEGLEDRPLAFERYEAARGLFHDVGDRRGVAVTLTNLGNLHGNAADLEQATVLHEEARDLYQAIGDLRGVAWSASNLGTLAAERGDHTVATAYLDEALTLYRDLGDQSGIVSSLEGFAQITRARGQHDHAVALFGAASAIREAIGSPTSFLERTRYQTAIADLRARLGASFETTWAKGQTLSLDAVIAIAREPAPVDAVIVREATSDASAEGLSSRELEVLKLMADGLTNQEIADTLFVSRRTATSHASSILGKLDLTSRTAAVAYAIRHGLA